MGLELAILPSQPPAAGIRAVYSASKLGLNLKKNKNHRRGFGCSLIHQKFGETLSSILAPCKLGVVVHTCNLSTWDAGARGLGVHCHPWLHSIDTEGKTLQSSSTFPCVYN